MLSQLCFAGGGVTWVPRASRRRRVHVTMASALQSRKATTRPSCGRLIYPAIKEDKRHARSESFCIATKCKALQPQAAVRRRRARLHCSHAFTRQAKVTQTPCLIRTSCQTRVTAFASKQWRSSPCLSSLARSGGRLSSAGKACPHRSATMSVNLY